MLDLSIPRGHGRYRYPDRIAASAPRGLRDLVKRAAEFEQIGSAALIRRAVEREVAEVLAKVGEAR